MQGVMLYSAQRQTEVSVLLLGCTEEQEKREGEIRKMDVSLGNAIRQWDYPWDQPGPMKERRRGRSAISNWAGKSR